jgi:hypothetical protein
MPKQTEPPAIVRISTNTIVNGKFYKRGEPLPFTKVEDLPPNLQPLVVSGSSEPEEPDGPRISYQLGDVYEVRDDDRLGRRLRRSVEQQAAQLESENDLEEELEAQLTEAGQLPPEVAESLQEDYQSSVAQQAAQLAATARATDSIADAQIEANEVPRMYVKRGSRHYLPAEKAKLKPSEAVFTKNASGRFEYVGETTGDCELPNLPITL